MHPLHHRLIAGSLLALFSITALAPVALAGRGREKHLKVRSWEGQNRNECVQVVPQRSVEYRYRSSGHGSTLAGFLGGVAVGAILSNATQSRANYHSQYAPQPAYCPPQPVYCPPPARYAADEDRYSYVDPYCRERFSSLDLYAMHVRRHSHHVMVVQVIDNRDNDCVDVIRYTGNHWQSCDRDENGDWDYGDDD